jgi:hypothetical protein
MLPSGLLTGLITADPSLPVRLRVLFGDLSSRFLSKGRVGHGHRYISRNGKVLLATDVALKDLAQQIAEMRLQVWHRTLLPGDKPEPFGFLLCVRGASVEPALGLHRANLVAVPASPCELAIDVGGRMWLEFLRTDG